MRSDVLADVGLNSMDSTQSVEFGHEPGAAAFAPRGLPSRSRRSLRRLVEPDGIEPTTSCLQSTRSPS